MESRKLTHLSLFSGIGGLDLAAEAAGFVTVGQIEYADFPRKVLEKNFPDVERWRDVRQFTVDDFRQRTGYSTVDILSGGFPCQPHSLAGKRLASRDERDLWGEMRRIICELRPRWFVAENVLGLLSSEHGWFFAGVLRDLSDLGYTVGWCVLSAAAVGALHRRERVAIVAHANRKPMEGLRCRNGIAFLRENDGSPSFRTQGIPISERLPRFSPLVSEGNDQFIKPLITREDDGFSGAMDRDKALGNAVVPQCFYLVFLAIREAIELMGE